MLYPPIVFSSPADMEGCGYYRVIWPLLAATKKGVLQAKFPKDPVMISPMEMSHVCPDSIMIQRAFREGQRQIISGYKKETDAIVVYTIDDWIGRVPQYSPHFKEMPKSYENDIRKAIRICDRLIVTNKFLANVYGRDIETFVIPNYLSKEIWGKAFDPEHFSGKFTKPRIGWSGGSGHVGDLEILRPIADELGDSVTWVFSGMIPKGFNLSNCEVVQPQGSANYPRVLRSLRLDLALAPLLDNDFNRAKSNLRLLEYGACGYPTIASDVLPYTESKAPVTLVPWDVKKWVVAIKDKLSERDKLPVEGQKLHDWVWSNYGMDDHVHEYSMALSPDRVGFEPREVENPDSTVDVLITVYDNLEVSKPCIESVLNAEDSHPHEIIVIDNGSTKPDVKEYLKGLETNPKITLHRIVKNEGYITGINEGLKLHPDRDCITLNSDTEVNGDWISRLRKAAYYHEKIATAIPFTNRGTLASFPRFQYPNEIENVAEVDSVAKLLPLEPVQIPTSVGFAMYMKRKALEKVGYFDSHAYGKGYGEENDWCMRARMFGWVDVLAPNVYVTHKEGQTFKNERLLLMQRAGIIIDKRFPAYSPTVQQWNRADPLNPARSLFELTQLKLRLWAHRDKGNPLELILCHSLGGGIEAYLQKHLVKDNVGAVILRGDYNAPNLLRITSNLQELFNTRNIDLRQPINSVAMLLKDFGLDQLMVETTVGMDLTITNWIKMLSEQTGYPLTLNVHDQFPLCPRIRMVTTTGVFCGGPEHSKCENCIAMLGTFAGYVDIDQWHQSYKELFKSAVKIRVPCKDMANRIEKFFEVKPEIVPHEIGVKPGKIQNRWMDGNLKVVLIGGLFYDKGSEVLRRCAEYAYQEELPIEFVVAGSVENLNAPLSNLTVLGSYKEADIADILKKTKGHLSWFPGICPETYSFTLSHAFRAGLWPVSFDLGAQAERIRDMKFGDVMDLSLWDKPKDIVDRLIQIGNQLKYYDEATI